MSNEIWVKSAKGTSLWHLYKDTHQRKSYYRGSDTVVWTECLTQLTNETVQIPDPPMWTARNGKKYWQKRVCLNCQAYYSEVLSHE